MIAGLQEIRHRLNPTSQGLFLWLPSLSRPAIDLQKDKAKVPAEYLGAIEEVRIQIDQQRSSDGSVCALAPIHSEGNHYTLLAVSQQSINQAVNVQYFETLFPASRPSRKYADACLELLCKSLQIDKPQLPARCNIREQTDGWSCGLWVLIYSENVIRRLILKEPRRATPNRFKDVLDRLNQWCQIMRSFQQRQNPPKPASTLPSVAPPLPPPTCPPAKSSGKAALRLYSFAKYINNE